MATISRLAVSIGSIKMICEKDINGYTIQPTGERIISELGNTIASISITSR